MLGIEHPRSRRYYAQATPGAILNSYTSGPLLLSPFIRGGTPMFMRLTAIALVFVSCVAGGGAGLSDTEFSLESMIAVTSTRENPTKGPILATEIYLMSPDGANLRRLTDNTALDAFAALSPDGKKIVF